VQDLARTVVGVDRVDLKHLRRAPMVQTCRTLAVRPRPVPGCRRDTLLPLVQPVNQCELVGEAKTTSMVVSDHDRCDVARQFVQPPW